MTEAEILASRVEVNPLGWLPNVGDCINVTFTPVEAKLLVAALRAPILTVNPQPRAFEWRLKGSNDEWILCTGVPGDPWQIAYEYRALGVIERAADVRAAVVEEAWSTDFSNAPTEMHDYFLVRPRGLSARNDKPFHPTIVQRVDGEFYASDNELEPIYFGQNEADDHPLKTTLEWRHFPQDWTALQPATPATGGQHG